MTAPMDCQLIGQWCTTEADLWDHDYGSGSAELLDDGTLEIEFAMHGGDEAVLKAKRLTSSAAC